MYIGILWNTVNGLKDDIIKDIGTFGKVVDFYEIDLGEQYDDFVRSVYAEDGIAEWKVEMKIEYMRQSDNNKIVLLFINVDDKEKRYNEIKKKEVIVNIENLKKFIRNKYSQQIENYYFDNVFHMTDDKRELEGLLVSLEYWFENIYEAYQDKNKCKELMLEEMNRNEN